MATYTYRVDNTNGTSTVFYYPNTLWEAAKVAISMYRNPEKYVAVGIVNTDWLNTHTNEE